MTTQNKPLKWCGCTWDYSMVDGRIIHPDNSWYYYSKKCVKLVNGNLELDIKYLPTEFNWCGVEYYPSYACGLIRSREEFGYGIFSADIQLPQGKQLWPSFWLVGNTEWPQCGEFDIVEAYSDSKGKYFKYTIPQFPYLVPSWNTTTNAHWYGDNKHCQLGARMIPYTKQCKDPSSNTIHYELEWRPNKLIFRANGKTIRECDYDIAKHFLKKTMNVVFNVWPLEDNFTIPNPMIISNFNYKELNQ